MADVGLVPRTAVRPPDGWGGDGLRALASAVAGGWRVVAATVLLVLGLALAGLWGVTPEYTVTLVVGPTARTGVAGMGARVPVAGGEAFGLAEPGAADETLSDFTRFLHLLTSIPVAQALMEDPGLLPRLFPDRWDGADGRWHPPAGAMATLRRGLLALTGRQETAAPDAAMVAAWLRRSLVVEPVSTTPMRRIRLRHPDRAFALALLGRVATLADDHLRRQAQQRSAAQIDSIRRQLAVVKAAEHQRVLDALLADQERVQMMMTAALPFAADPIEPSNASTVPDWPDPAVVMAAALAAGVSLGLGLACAVRAWRGCRDGR